MKLLLLGGTVFLGRHLIDSALARGHEVTMFNRGRTRTDLFPDVERLTGNRDGDLGALKGRSWDAVIDTCGYVPRIVAQSANALADSAGHYTFVSSISVYADFGARQPDESSPVGTIADPAVETVNGETYGPLKALCEQAVQNRMGERAFIVRPGLLVGPLDHTGRFTYWVTRVAAGGDVLAPGDPEMQVQFIDTRDGAEWMVRCAEAKVTGVRNMTGPREPLSMREFLDACRTALNPSSRLVWLDEQFLLERGVKPWTEVPLWIPSSEQGLLAVAIDKALSDGLTFRPLAETLRDTLAWHGSAEASRPLPERISADPRPQIGLLPERESALLAEWAARRAAPAAA